MKKLILLFCIFGLVTESLAQFPVPPYGQNLVRGRISGKNAMGHTVPALDPTNWYVSATGDDAAGGHSTATAWKSITKLNTQVFTAGDSVFFNKGDTFAGQANITQSGTAGSPITLTSYGTGAKPIISGREVLTGWTQIGATDRWTTTASATVYALYVNGVKQTLARLPNRNGDWYRIKTAANTTTFADSTEVLGLADNYFNGATAHIRTTAYGYDIVAVSDYDSTTQTFTVATMSGSPPAYAGFFLDGLVTLVDTVGEWFCNTSTKLVTCQFTTGVNPNTLTVEGVETQYGISTAQSYITVNGLCFEKQYGAGIYVSGTPSNVIISSDSIANQYGHGIQFASATSASTVSGCKINDIGQAAIFAQTVNTSTFTSNTIKRCQLVPGLQYLGFGIYTYSGLGGNTFTLNSIDSTGASGLYMSTSSTATYNEVSRWGLGQSDLGGIYMDGDGHIGSHNLIRHNIIRDAEGYGLSHVEGLYGDLKGIYLDQNSDSTRVDSNVVYNVRGQGIEINYRSDHDTLVDNTIYNTTANSSPYVGYGMFIYTDTTKGDNVYGDNFIRRNTFFNRDTARIRFVHYYDAVPRVGIPTWHSIGSLDSNNYLVPYAQNDMFRFSQTVDWTATLCNFQRWKDSTAEGANSKGATYESHTYKTATDSLFVNNTAVAKNFTLTANAWSNPVTGAIQATPLSVLPYSATVLMKPLPRIIDSALANRVNNAVQTLTITITDSTNGYLVAQFGYYHATKLTGTATYNGVAMTQLGSAWKAGSSCGVITFGLKLPNLGAHDVVITFSEAPDEGGFIAFSATNVNQTTSVGTWVDGGDGDVAVVTAAAGDLVIDGMASYSTYKPTDQTRVAVQFNGNTTTSLYVSKAVGATSVTMSYNSGGYVGCIVGFPLKGL